MARRYRKSLANPDAAHSDARDLALQLGCLARKILPKLLGQKLVRPPPSISAHILRLEKQFVKTVKTMQSGQRCPHAITAYYEGLVVLRTKLSRIIFLLAEFGGEGVVG